MRANRARDTGPELTLRRLLHARGMRYSVDRRVEPEIRTRVDVAFPRAKVAVFVDGCFWHRCPEHATMPRTNHDFWHAKFARNVERDRAVTGLLEERGWAVVRVWEHEDPNEAATRIEQLVRTRIASNT